MSALEHVAHGGGCRSSGASSTVQGGGMLRSRILPQRYSVAKLVARYHLSFGAGPVGQPLPDTLPPPSGLPRANLSLAVEAVVGGIYSGLGATRRCVMAPGASEDEYKLDLCRAVADGKIRVRVRIAGGGDRVFSSGNVGVPRHLGPSDFDWAQSRPVARWYIGPKPGQHYYWNGGQETLDLIELSTSDVKSLFGCGSECTNNNPQKKPTPTAAQESAAIKALASHLKTNRDLTRADALAWCHEKSFALTDRGFQNRVWPKARKEAGLEEKAAPGRKRKSQH
jgi:hypothetical protein